MMHVIHVIYIYVVFILLFNPTAAIFRSNTDTDGSPLSGDGHLDMTEKQLLKYRHTVLEKGNSDPKFKDRYHRMIRSDAGRPLIGNWTDLLGEMPILVIPTGKLTNQL